MWTSAVCLLRKPYVSIGKKLMCSFLYECSQYFLWLETSFKQNSVYGILLLQFFVTPHHRLHVYELFVAQPKSNFPFSNCFIWTNKIKTNKYYNIVELKYVIFLLSCAIKYLTIPERVSTSRWNHWCNKEELRHLVFHHFVPVWLVCSVPSSLPVSVASEHQGCYPERTETASPARTHRLQSWTHTHKQTLWSKR